MSILTIYLSVIFLSNLSINLSIHFKVEFKHQTVIHGQVFCINSQRLRTGSRLKLSVNFDEDTISLSKEVPKQFKELVLVSSFN